MHPHTHFSRVTGFGEGYELAANPFGRVLLTKQQVCLGCDRGPIPCIISEHSGFLARLAMPGRKKQLCGARTRRGTPCRCKALANGRCRLHGGLSTGPKTLRGKMKAFQNLRQYRDRPHQGVYDVVDLLERKGYAPATGGVNKPGR